MTEVKRYDTYHDYDVFLDEFEKHVNKTIDQLFVDFDKAEEAGKDMDETPYEVKIEFGGVQFVFGPCAAEHNGLLEFIEFVKSEQ